MRPVKEVLYPSCSVCVFTLGYPSGLPIWAAPFPCAMAPTVKATKATATAAATFASTDSFIFPHSLILPPPIESVQSSPSEGFASCFDSQQPNGCLLSPHGPRLHRLMKVAMRNNSLRPIIFDDLRRSDCREKKFGSRRPKSISRLHDSWLAFGQRSAFQLKRHRRKRRQMDDDRVFAAHPLAVFALDAAEISYV